MRVAVRVDASLRIGTGHVMRCLTLASVLRERGATVFFISGEHDGHLCGLIEEWGFAVHRLRVADASWQMDAALSTAAIEQAGMRPDLLVVDHYALDERWEKLLRPFVGRILVVDDLADRRHDCDLLLDQNLHDSPDSRYKGLVAATTRVFVGPCYALLRPEFDNASVRLRAQGLRRLLVFFGGVDPTNEAFKLIRALRDLGNVAPLTELVIGPVNPYAAEIHQSARGMPGVNVVGSTDEMARLVSEADLGIGTCGGAAWERCALALPSLIVVNADNQRDDARILHAMGAVRNLGDSSAITIERWVTEISALKNDPAALVDMSRAAAAVMQGRKEVMRDFEAAIVG